MTCQWKLSKNKIHTKQRDSTLIGILLDIYDRLFIKCINIKRHIDFDKHILKCVCRSQINVKL